MVILKRDDGLWLHVLYGQTGGCVVHHTTNDILHIGCFGLFVRDDRPQRIGTEVILQAPVRWGRRIGFGPAGSDAAGQVIRFGRQWVVSDPSNLGAGYREFHQAGRRSIPERKYAASEFSADGKDLRAVEKYYDALRSVHNLVKSARRVQQTMLLVGDISDIYISNFRSMLDDTNYSAEELTAMAAGYTKLLSASADLLNDLKQIITPSGLSMTDKERLDIIDRIYYEMLEYRNLTEYYTRKNISVSFLRSRQRGDSGACAGLYGGHNDRYW